MCLDYVIVFNEASCIGVRSLSWCTFAHPGRISRRLTTRRTRSPLQAAELGVVVAIRQVGGLHHRYERGPPELPSSNWVRMRSDVGLHDRMVAPYPHLRAIKLLMVLQRCCRKSGKLRATDFIKNQ